MVFEVIHAYESPRHPIRETSNWAMKQNDSTWMVRSNQMDIWATKRDLDSDRLYRAQIGPLVLWFTRAHDEIHIAAERLTAESVENETTSFARVDDRGRPNLDWKRWVVGDACSQILILPVMPDRPVVVRPDVPVKIPKDQEALFFFSIPAWARIVTVKPERTILCEEPSVVRSNIWFGDLTSGELCYSLRSRARRNVADIEAKPHRVACPVRIRNATGSQFDVERFCVHVEYLNIYKGTTRLWTNEVLISYQGEDAVNKIEYAQKPPGYEAVEGIIGEARAQFKETLLKKSLGTFKLLTGF
jgi:hypothetical protein